MSYDSVSKDDLAQQNRKLQEVLERLNKENEQLIEEARKSLNEDLADQAEKVGQQVDAAGETVDQVKETAGEIKGKLNVIARAGASVTIMGIWIAATAAGSTLWIQSAGVHPGLIALLALLAGIGHLGLITILGATS